MKIKNFVTLILVFLLIVTPASFTQDLTGIGLGPPVKDVPGEKEDVIKVTMDFENAELKDILKAFSRQTGANFIASEDIEGKVITVYLNNVSIDAALSAILESNGLSYDRKKDNVFLITKSGLEPVKTITRVYKLNYIQVYDMDMKPENEGFLETTPFRLPVGGEEETGGGGAPGAGAGGETHKNIIEVMKTLMSSHGKIVANRRTNSLVIKDIPEVFDAIEKTIEALDVEPIQVMIQAEILETTLEGVKRIGVEYGTESQTASATYGDLVAGTTWPFTANFVKDLFRGALGDQDAAVTTSPTNFTFGTLTAADTQIILKLFANDEDTKLLSRPRILTINNEPAVVKISANTSIGQITTNVAETSATIEEAERVETGVVLKVVPSVNAKGDIFLYLEPSIARTQTSTFFTTSYLDPQIRSAHSTVMIRDGETVVIAGLIETNNWKTTRKVPILGDIPIIGELFKSRYKKDEDTEILIFVTPHIVKKRGDQYIIPDVILEREGMMQKALDKYSPMDKRRKKKKDKKK